LSDVDLSTTAPTDGQSLVYNGVTGMWEPATITGGGGGSTFVSLTDTPSNYTGKAGLFPVVNSAETALEFTSIAVEAVQYAKAQRWRIHSLDSANTFVAISEIEFIDREGSNIAVGGMATASSEETPGSANDAFD